MSEVHGKYHGVWYGNGADVQEVYDNGDSEVFLCLANIFEVEENEILSKSARVDLQTLFSNQEIDEVDSANQKKSEMMKKLQWCIEGGGGGAAAEISDKNTPHGDPMIKKPLLTETQ
ncbi:unnamed protein product [Sphagnum troendelagicum]|uniref:Uncharacterized protein n=1 Tax=Sphagnum jensenii TaxID=128206 RepID=A0ABP0W4S9_9BRYO